jgi:glycosyl transferase family 25
MIYVINLKKDISKKEFMISQLSNLNLNYEFIDAVYGKELNEKEVKGLTNLELTVNSIGRGLSLGELGCALSHKSIYEKIIEKKQKYALILEDDININSGVVDFLDNINKLPKNGELYLLGYQSDCGHKDIKTKTSIWKRKKITLNNYVGIPCETAYGAYGYLISLKGAKKLLSHLDKIILPLDHYTCAFNYLNNYLVSPRLIRINNELLLSSTISSELDRTNNNIPKNSLNRLVDFAKSIYRQVKIIPNYR